MQTGWRLRLFLAGVISTALACTADAQDEPDQHGVISDIALEQFRSETDNPRHLEMLADGHISFAEYEEAVLAYVACATSRGIDVHVELRFQGKHFEIRATYPGDRAEELSALNDECFLREIGPIRPAWGLQVQPTEQELQEARAALAACLRDAGIEVPEDATSDDFANLPLTRPFAQCADHVAEQFGILGFGG